MNSFFCKDCGVSLDGLHDPRTGRCAECEKKYMTRMNNDICGGCKKREKCPLAWRFLMINCLEKEDGDDKS